MKTPAAVFEAVPVGPFSFPLRGHSGNLLLRLTGKMENRLRPAIIDRLLAHDARRQPRQQAFLCSPDTWRYEFYLAKSWRVSAIVQRQASEPCSSKNQTCLHTGFP